MRRIALIAAEGFEIAPLTGHQERLGWVCVAGGPGFRLARRAAERAAESGPLDAMVSIGVCGALAPELALGDIVVDSDAGVPRVALPHRRGRVVSQDRVAVTKEEKAELSKKGIAVEMESAAVREVAAARGVPFYCVKSVSDTAEEAFPMDFNAYRDGEGRFELKRIAMAAMVRPWVVPGLVRLERRAKFAAGKLGEFLVHCEF